MAGAVVGLPSYPDTISSPSSPRSRATDIARRCCPSLAVGGRRRHHIDRLPSPRYRLRPPTPRKSRIPDPVSVVPAVQWLAGARPLAQSGRSRIVLLRARTTRACRVPPIITSSCSRCRCRPIAFRFAAATPRGKRWPAGHLARPVPSPPTPWLLLLVRTARWPAGPWLGVRANVPSRPGVVKSFACFAPGLNGVCLITTLISGQ